MKKLNWFNKMIFFFNIVLAVLTFIAYVLPFLAPKLYPLLSVLTLSLPLILIINMLFFIYWFFQFKRQMLVSGVVLLIGITFINRFYKFSGKELPEETTDFVVMSYNVRLFNLYNWIKNDSVSPSISSLIKEKNPDILCIQEYSNTNKVDFRIFKHKYIFVEGKNTKLGHAIFSKYPIVNKGIINFPNSTNNAVFVDLKRGKDTIRTYSIHLQSIKITPEVHELDNDINSMTKNRSKRVLKRIRDSFKEQQLQASIIKEHKKDCSYPIILCGDMNNSAFSYVYRSVRGDLKDAFVEAGEGFGKSFDVSMYPARIDYIFVDKKINVKEFKTYADFHHSDHFPMVSRLSME